MPAKFTLESVPLSLIGSDSSVGAGFDPATGRFKRGHKSEYRTRQKLVQERLAALLAAFQANKPADIALLSIAALHLVDAEKCRRRSDRVRASNAAARILREIPRKPERFPTLDEMLAR